MVDDNKNGVKAIQRGEVSDEVHRALSERVGFSACFYRKKSWIGWSAVDFVLLTLGAALDVSVHEVGQARISSSQDVVVP
jgi:hypothetical protein